MKGDGNRAARLKKAFRDFLNGTRSVAATCDAELFLEAFRAQHSSSVCLELVLGSSSGLAAVQKSVRASSSLPFICSQVLPFVRFLSQPEAKAICEGTLLFQVIDAIVDPPTAWNAILGHYVAGGFGEEDVETFAWLCSENCHAVHGRICLNRCRNGIYYVESFIFKPCQLQGPRIWLSDSEDVSDESFFRHHQYRRPGRPRRKTR